MKILVVVAHSDDEILGCGGTILKHISQGDEVKVIFLTDGVGSRGVGSSEVQRRARSTISAMEKMGVKNYTSLSFPDNKLDSVPLLDIVQVIEDESKDFFPETIYTHFYGDLNIDHQIVNRAVKTSFRPLPETSVSKILSFEVLSSTEWGFRPFDPNYFVNISEFKDLKMEALKAYDEEMRVAPHTRSYENVESLMMFRGHSVGYKYAEAFCVERIRES
jgi:LmbE family N-acetylglucosaminyl deacetylase